jgi:Domain of unknown function (DU1801)
MATKDPRVDACLAKSADFARPILNHIRKVVHTACPDVVETMKWGYPHFDYQGMLCRMAAFKNHCSFGFYKGELILRKGAGGLAGEGMGALWPDHRAIRSAARKGAHRLRQESCPTQRSGGQETNERQAQGDEGSGQARRGCLYQHGRFVLGGQAGEDCHAPDTKAEENAWNSMLLASAQAMMPHHPNVAKWRQKASEYQISAYSPQSDLTNSMLVDGKAAKDWLQGYNVFADGVLVNHNRVHPDYMLAQETCFASMVAVSLARQYIPQSMVFNTDLAYRALTEVQFTPGADSSYGTGKAVAAPGGTIYTLRGNRLNLLSGWGRLVPRCVKPMGTGRPHPDQWAG